MRLRHDDSFLLPFDYCISPSSVATLGVLTVMVKVKASKGRVF